MIKHIVFFKLEDESDAVRYTLKNRLEAMKNEIPILKNIEVGVDINRSGRAYDLCLITEFNSKKDLKSYASNPVHLEVIKYIKSQNILTNVVDYEV